VQEQQIILVFCQIDPDGVRACVRMLLQKKNSNRKY